MAAKQSAADSERQPDTSYSGRPFSVYPKAAYLAWHEWMRTNEEVRELIRWRLQKIQRHFLTAWIEENRKKAKP